MAAPIFITETDPAKIYAALQACDISAAHFTNGTYAFKASLIVPTILAGFQHCVDTEAGEADLIVAVNSDKSMSALMDQKIALGTATAEEKGAVEDQTTRAMKAVGPLSQQYPDRKVVALFYDEATPNALYDGLHKAGLKMESLFKWGYGTNPKAGVIEGAENFAKVYAYPLPNDKAPLATELTRMNGQVGQVSVIDLREEVGSHGLPFISPKGEVLFRLLGTNKVYAPAGPKP